MNLKNYQFKKIKFYLKNNNFLLFFNGLNNTCKSRTQTEQKLKKLELSYYKTYNKIARIIFRSSIFFNFYKSINGLFFFFKIINKNISLNKKNLFSKKLSSLFFTLLFIKLNNKIYLKSQLKNLVSLNYKTNIAVFHQFLIVKLKSFFLTK